MSLAHQLVSEDPSRKEIEQATSVAELKGIRDKVKALQDFTRASGKGRDEINRFAEPKVDCECKAGLLLREVERSAGGRPGKNSPQAEASFTAYQQTLSEVGLAKATAERWQVMSWLPEAERKAYYAATKEAQRIITSEEVFRLGKKAMPHDTIEPDDIEGTDYSVLIVDPPWPMQKIERDVRPNQAGFDYPTMNEEELAAFFREKLLPSTAADCHAFIWTTQKFLPMAFRLLEPLGVRYVLTMVWHKPGGFQPHGLPQYNCEFVVYARSGSPEFVDTKAFNCCFEAPRREHSRKPDEFYDLISRVTAGRRLDVFSREKRDGFDQYGNQTAKFEGAA